MGHCFVPEWPPHPRVVRHERAQGHFQGNVGDLFAL